MENTRLNELFSNIEQLTQQHELLKQYAQKLDDENRFLKKQNNELMSKNANAKSAIHAIIDKLKEEQA